MTTIPLHSTVNWSPGGGAPGDLSRSPKRKLVGNERSVEDRLNLLLQVAHIIPWEADGRTSQFTYVGPQAEPALGFPIAEWYQPDFWTAHLHPEDRERTIAEAATLSQAFDDYELEYRMIAKDGRTVWLHSLVTVERGHRPG